MSSEQYNVSGLMPGDVLLYAPSSFFGRAIAWMTSGNVSHVEVYKGGGISYASRDGLGVEEYPLRTEQLCGVLRSREPLDMTRMASTFANLKGHGYDWSAIAKFASGGKLQGGLGKEICSEFATIVLRAAGMHRLFGAETPDSIAPRDFEKSDLFWQVWSA